MRERVFLISKVWYSQLGFEQTLQAVERSLEQFSTPYLDMYLIHWPQCYEDVEWMNCQVSSK